MQEIEHKITAYRNLDVDGKTSGAIFILIDGKPDPGNRDFVDVPDLTQWFKNMTQNTLANANGVPYGHFYVGYKLEIPFKFHSEPTH
jgi:hypothetical protein